MSPAIWTLLYRVAECGRSEYLDWFHGTHIPEKLARPGYEWAAHYEYPVEDGVHGFVAFFGGSSTRVFHDPSPAQLKLQQDALTRQMLWRMLGAQHPMEAHRVDSRGIQSRGASDDAREGVTSFLEKRDPDYPDKVSAGLPDIFPDYEQPEFH